jgi:transcriptional regulator
MYTPQAYRVTNHEETFGVIRQNSFATIVTVADGIPVANHAPILLDAQRGPYGTLITHLARTNPQAAQLAAGQEALFIFQGPHAYISPSWYEAELAVPTWNYVVVHAYGRAQVIEDERELRDQLQQLVHTYESGRANPWPGQLPDDFMGKLMRGIVGFEIPIIRLESKAKLSQNRSRTDRAGVVEGLRDSPFEAERGLAQLMQEQLDA